MLFASAHAPKCKKWLILTTLFFFQIKTYKKKKSKDGTEIEAEKIPKEIEKPQPPAEEPTTPKAQLQAKYPKRENRKPPAHLAEAFGPALFSTPDIIRRISVGDEVPQTPPEKKNFTVGIQKVPVVTKPGIKSAEKSEKPENPSPKVKKIEQVLKEPESGEKKVKLIAKETNRTNQSLLKPVNLGAVVNVVLPSEKGEEEVISAVPAPVPVHPPGNCY